MANLELGPGYAEIALLAARDIRTDFDGTFLYVEAEEGRFGQSLFKDVGDKVIYRDGSSELTDKIIEVWEAEEPDKRWTVMHMTINAETFDASFGFDEMFDENDPGFDHREVAIRERFGDKPVDYSEP
jgi:signal peptidase I